MCRKVTQAIDFLVDKSDELQAYDGVFPKPEDQVLVEAIINAIDHSDYQTIEHVLKIYHRHP